MSQYGSEIPSHLEVDSKSNMTPGRQLKESNHVSLSSHLNDC